VAESTVTTTSARIARSNCLRSRNVVDGAVNTARTSAPALDNHACSSSVSRTGRELARPVSLVRLAAAQQVSPQGHVPGVRATSRFSGSTASYLTPSPVGFVAGPFGGQLEGPHGAGMGTFGVGERLRGRHERSRLEDGEHLFEDTVLQPPSTQALAAFLTAIELFGETSMAATRSMPAR